MKTFISQAFPGLDNLSVHKVACMETKLGIRVTAVGPNFICGEMPVGECTRQPMGLLHGGASITLAETLGSYGSAMLTANEDSTRIAGIEVSGSHIKAVRSGVVTGVCRPVRLGRTLHFWRIDIFDDNGDLICAARLTVKISRRGTVISTS